MNQLTKLTKLLLNEVNGLSETFEVSQSITKTGVKVTFNATYDDLAKLMTCILIATSQE